MEKCTKENIMGQMYALAHMSLFLLAWKTNNCLVATQEAGKGSLALALKREKSFQWRAKVLCHSGKVTCTNS